jgi:DNA-binding XRE family transcriptional regulator
MTKDSYVSDSVLLTELGRGLADRRIRMGLTQAELAKQAGIGKRTLERIEAGNSCQTSALIRILRILKLQGELMRIIPPSGPSPMDLLRLKGRKPRRASSKTRPTRPRKKWAWGDEA